MTLLGNALEDLLNPRQGRHYLEPEPIPPVDQVIGSPAGWTLAVRDLSVEFTVDETRARAVDGVSFEVARGEQSLVGDRLRKTTTICRLSASAPGGEIVAASVFEKGKTSCSRSESAGAVRKMARILQGAMNALNPSLR